MKAIASISLILALSANVNVTAQFLSTLTVETSFSTKFSIGQEITKTIEYEPGLTINYPSRSTFANAVYALETAFLFPITGQFQMGLSSGIAFTPDVINPLTGDEYFHRVMIPLTGQFLYAISLGPKTEIAPNLSLGYQFSNSVFSPTEDGFLYIQNGGLTAGLKIRVSTQTGKYRPYFVMGYELNQINNEVSLGWINGYEYDDKYQFVTHYHLLNLGIGIKM